MNRYEFEYCGINSRTDLHLVMGHVALPIAPAMSESVVSIPNKYGNEYYGTSWESKVITIPCTMPAVDYTVYVQTLQNLTNVLINLDDDPGTEYPLTFGINPDVTYYGHFTQIPTPTFMSDTVTDVQFTLDFTMSDPRGFLPKQTIKLDGSIDNKVTPDGNAPTEPIISIIPKRAIYYCGYVLNGGQVAVGTDDEDELASPQPKYTTVVNDPMTTLANWTSDSSVISQITDNGTIKSQGTMDSTGGALIVKTSGNGQRDFGATVDSWYGCLKRYTKGPTQSLPNFRVEVFLRHQKFTGTHNGRAMGRAGYLVLDPDGQTIARLEIEDNRSGGGRSPILYLQICRPGNNFSGGDSKYHSLYDFHGSSKFYVSGNGKNQTVKIPYKATEIVKTKKKGKNKKTTVVSQKKTVTKYKTVDNANNRDVFSDFYGKLWIEKDGDDWSYGAVRYNPTTRQPYKDKKYAYSMSGKWHDSKKQFSDLKLGGMAIIAMKHQISEDAANPVIKYHEPYLSFSSMIIKKVNTVTEVTPQVIAEAGDELIVNTEDQQVTLNGDPAGFQASTDWPKLNGGRVNELMFAGDIADADIQLQLTPKIK